MVEREQRLSRFTSGVEHSKKSDAMLRECSEPEWNAKPEVKTGVDTSCSAMKLLLKCFLSILDFIYKRSFYRRSQVTENFKNR